MPKTLMEAVVYFSDEDRALAYFAPIRWANGPVCPDCGCSEHSFLKTVRRWKCKACKKQYSVKVGTVMEDSPIKLGTWLVVMWLLANAKNGVSSWEVHRATGVTQKTAWFMLQRVRLAMQTDKSKKFAGAVNPVEADESYFGGRLSNKHVNDRKGIKGRGMVGKTPVMGLLHRKGEVRLFVIENAGAKVLQGIIRKNVLLCSKVYTDNYGGYVGLGANGDFYHDWVSHVNEYVKGEVHTNGLENFWSLFKRTVKGTYVCPSPWHMFRYCDEQAWRFNNRKDNDGGRMVTVAGSVAGKRLTYASLTNQQAQG